MENYKTATFDAVVKDVDTKRGIVEGYFNTWGVVDSDNDELVPGAFKKTLQERGPGSSNPRIYHLLQHNSTMPLSRFTEEGTIREDNKGLYFMSKVSKTTYGRDTLLLYEDGVINEHSIGIQVVKEERDNNQNHRLIKEVLLWEGSTVTWGANEWTPTVSVKDLEANDMGEKFAKRIDNLTKSIRNGGYSDETFVLLELQLKQVEAQYKALIKALQPGGSTGDQDQPADLQIPDLGNIFNNLNK